MNFQEPKYENKDICKKCGGFCCKKCGCDYFVKDFDNFKFDYLDNILQEGKISIIASFDFTRLKNGKLVYEPILSLRERNINRDIVDLLSFKTTCASLTEFGCTYDITKRPSGGIALIPSTTGPCYSEINRIEELNKWRTYQKVLSKLVKKYTNMSVEEKIKNDVETLVFNILTENYEGVNLIEIEEIKKMLPYLQECFPNECKNALLKYRNSTSKIIKKKKK